MTQCPNCRSEIKDGARFCNDCGASIASSDDAAASRTETIQNSAPALQLGDLFAGRYLVIEELGRGGMGRVYRVLDKKLDVEIALKILKPEIAADASIIDRFKNELKLSRMISHAHVCRMFDLSEDRGRHYITMEFVRGEDLKHTIVRLGRLSPEKAVAIAKQVCEGLTAAHHLEIIHRDLKPQNIMIDDKGNVRIMDFGISRSLKAKGITADGIMIGTPEYISPEQAEGGKVDPRSDIYSFGAIFFEMVTGKVPFEGDTTLSIIMKQKLEPAPDPRTINSQLPKEIARVILRCLEKDRSRRYPDVEALFGDLEKIERTLHLNERSGPRSGARKSPPSRRRSKRLLFAALIGVAGLAALSILYWGRSTPLKTDAEPVEKRSAATPPAPLGSTAAAEEKKTIPDVAKQVSPLPVKAQEKEPPPPAPSSAPKDKPAGDRVPKNLAPPTTFLLEIGTDPPGGRVSLDDGPAEIAPARLRVSPGLHRVMIGLSGYATVQEALKIETDLARTFALEKNAPARIRFNVQPYADVYLDDKLVGEVPPINIQTVPAGKYILKFASPRLDKSFTFEFEIKPGESKEIRINMLTGERKIIDFHE